MVAIEHIGSTAIPGIKAKPIIDILLVVRDIERVDAKNNAMQNLGYEALGEYGIPGRRYFRKRKGEEDTHHVHTFQEGNPEVQRHVLFRDYLRAHADEAQAYTRLKERLAEQFQHDIDVYTEGKSGFIQRIDQLAKKK